MPIASAYVTAFAALWLGVSAYRYDHPHTNPQSFDQACKLVKLGQYDAAISIFNQCLKEDPDCAQVYIERARTYAAQNRIDLANKDLDKAESMKSTVDLTSVYKARGLVAFKTGDMKKSVDWYSLVLLRTPFDDGARKSRIFAYEKIGRRDLAAKDRALLGRQSLPNRLYKFQAADQIVKGKYDAAIETLKRAKESYPVDPDFDLLLGECYSHKGEHDRALAFYNTAVKAATPDQHYAPLYLARGKEYLRRKRYNDAIADFTLGLSLKSDKERVEFFELRSQAYDSLGKKAQAAADRKTAAGLKTKSGD